MKVFINFTACIETELDDRYLGLVEAGGDWYYDKSLERLMSDCITDAEMKVVDLLPDPCFDIEAYAVKDENDHILAEI